MLGVVAVEHRGGQERGGARERAGEFDGDGLGRGKLGLAEEGQDQLHVLDGGGLVEGDADRVGVAPAEVEFFGGGGGVDALGPDVGDGERVEDRLRVDLRAEGGEALGEQAGEQLHTLGDFPEALGSVVNGIHRGHDGEQYLCGADVGRGLVAADVLLARAEGQPHGGVALGILRHADEPAGHLALEGILRGEETGMRSAEAERHAEALRGADRDIRPEPARGAEQRQREEIGGDDGESAGGVGGGEEIRIVLHAAGRVGVLDEHAEAAGPGLERAPVTDGDRDPERLGAGFHNVDGLRMTGGIDEEAVVGGGIALLEPVAHHHRLGGGGALVEHGGVGDLEAGEVADEGLEVEQRFESALRNLGLIGGVGGVPAGVLEDVPLDDAGHERVGVTQANQAAKDLVLGGHPAELGEGGAFAGGGGEIERAAADVRGHGGVNQRVERRIAQLLQHGGGIGGIVAGMAAGKGILGGKEVAGRRHPPTLGEEEGRATAIWPAAGQLRVCFETESGAVWEGTDGLRGKPGNHEADLRSILLVSWLPL